MIRNVVLMKLAPDATDEQHDQLDAALLAISALGLPGQLAARVGRDLGLREGGWDAAITSDWVDADAYRGYDADAEHNVHRAAIVAVCTQVARVQFEV